MTFNGSNLSITSSVAGSPVLTLSNTTAPASGSNGPRIVLVAQGGAGNITGIDFKPYHAAAFGATINGIDDGAVGANLTFSTQTGNTALSERMRIMGSGNVGINCNAPAYALDVTGTINASSNINAQGGTITIVGSSTLLDLWNYCSLQQSSSNLVVQSCNTLTLRSTASNVVFATPNFSWSFSNTAGAGSTVLTVASNGAISNATATSNTIGGVMLSNTNISNAGTITTGGNVGINQSAPVGQLHVKTTGNATVTGAGWGTDWVLITPVANSGTPANTPALGLGYDNSIGRARIVSVAPNTGWRDLELHAGNIYLTPNDGGNVGISTTTPGYRLDVLGPTTYTPASGATARLTTPSSTGYALSNLTTSTYNGTSSIQMASLQLTYDGLSNYGANIAGGIQQYQGGILSLGVMADSTNVAEVMRSTPAGTWFPASGGVQISGSNALNIQVPGSIFMAGTAAGNNGFIYSRRSDNSTGSVANLATAFGASNFTIECWVYPTYTSAYTSLAIFSTGVPGTSEIRIAQSITASNTPGFVIGTTAVQGTANAMVSNVWYHMALVRNGNVFTLYINGVSNAGSTITGFTFANAGTILMGTFDGGANYYTGFIGNIRITNGRALYTGTFTPPVGALEFVAGTSLLMNIFSGATATFDSANAALFSLAGFATWSEFSPNSNTASSRLATLGSVGNITQTVYYNTGNANTGSATRRLDINATTDYLTVYAPTFATSSTFGTYITSVGLQIDATTGPTTLQSSNQSWTFRNTAGAGSNVFVVASNGAISNGIGLTSNTIGGIILSNNIIRATNTGSNRIGGVSINNATVSGISSLTMSGNLTVGGGLTLSNGYRPLYSNVTATSLNPVTTTYGTHYYITNAAFSAITIPVPNVTNDLNAYWVFRNATGTYLSITYTWPTIALVAPSPATNVLTIPPANTIAVMFVYTGGGGGNYGSYSGSFYWAVF